MKFCEAVDLLDDGRRVRRSSWDRDTLFLFRRDYKTLKRGEVVDSPLVEYMRKDNIAEIVEVYGVCLVVNSARKKYIFPYTFSLDEKVAYDWEEV